MNSKHIVKKGNSEKKESRLIKKLTNDEAVSLKRFFSTRGRKAHFIDKTGINRITVNSVLKNKQGIVRVITAIKKYHEKNQTA